MDRWIEKKETRQALRMDLIGTLKEALTGKKLVRKENEIFEEIYKFSEAEKTNSSKFSKAEKVSFIGFGLLVLNIIILIFCYLNGFMNLRKVILSNSLFYILPVVNIPFINWILSTNENFWAFHKRKKVHFYLCCINAFLVLMQPVYTLIRSIMMGMILSIKPDEVLTFSMLVLLVYILLLAVLGAICIVIYSQLEPLLTSKTLKRQIELFKLSHFVDNREARDYKYDIDTIKDLETGKSILVKERDRMNQLEINGASGTGKTSSIFLPVIERDLDQKIKNKEKRQEEFVKLIKAGKATIKGPLTEFSEDAITPVGHTKNEWERNKKALGKVKKNYPDCGMTVIAPNASLIREIVRIAKARGIRVNVLDPMNDYSEFENVNTVGINPFYVPLNLSEEERAIYISQAANVFAEVLIATNQMNGAQSDVYFTDISLSVSSNVAAVVMLARNIEGKQAYIDEVQNCISDFSNLKDYIKTIKDHYKVNLNVLNDTKNSRNTIITADTLKEGQKEMENKDTSKITNTNDVKDNPYYMQLLFVSQELLGSGSKDMFSQARGLRNLINKVLQDTRIKRKLSEGQENLIEFDRILAKNEITVVNTAIELGKSSSTAFGLFFILLHKVSVLRRPEETRTPHFLWIDEASQYMHPCYEDMISLYRQYMTAVVITLQSLTQTQKSQATAYLKHVFLGAGTHVVFGRLSAEEMKLYSEMAGIERDIMEQKSHTSKSILTQEPSYTESVRNTPTISNTLEAADLRILDFQELTIFTTDNGRVLPGKQARVFFLNPDAYSNKKQRQILWEKLVPEAFVSNEELSDSDKGKEEAESMCEEQNVPKLVSTVVPEEEKETVLIQKTEQFGVIEESEEKINFENLSLEDIYALLRKGNADVKEQIPDQEAEKESKEEVAKDELLESMIGLNNLENIRR